MAPVRSDSEDGRFTAAKCKQCMRVFFARLFSHIGLCGLVIGYTIMGAFTFEALEAKEEIRKRSVIKQYREDCLLDMWAITDKLNVLYKENWTILIGNRLRTFEQTVVNAVKNEGYDGKDEQDSEKQWSFSGALLYSVTVITTIGYGNIAPKTDTGKVVTILYALLGVPLMLLCLTNIGDLFAHTFKFAYSRICCVLCRRRAPRSPRAVLRDGSIRYLNSNLPPPGPSPSKKAPPPPLTPIDVTVEGSETESCQLNTNKSSTRPPLSPNNLSPAEAMVPPADDPPQPSDHSEVVTIVEPVTGSEVMHTSESARVPIYLVLSFVVGYICVGAMIFSFWENWTFLNGAYFCFITLSTIGFGDLVPGTSILDTNTEVGQVKLIICCFYLIMGLAIIAMSFNLVQEEVISKCKDIGRNMGILKDEDEDD